jgi:hypothetical protein
MSLDDDLAAWAASVRLPDADAAAIFQRIVATPVATAPTPVAPAPDAAAPRLKPSWWRGYNAGFAARMVASTAPVRLAA